MTTPTFLLDPHSGVPVYLQLVDQVKRAVALGALAPGQQLPTVKALALSLTINVNTVSRAYRELERDEVIETSTRGSFVRSDPEARNVRRAVDGVVAAALTDAVREARSLGVERAALCAHFEDALTRWYPAQTEDR